MIYHDCAKILKNLSQIEQDLSHLEKLVRERYPNIPFDSILEKILEHYHITLSSKLLDQ